MPPSLLWIRLVFDSAITVAPAMTAPLISVAADQPPIAPTITSIEA